jgi:uncharacterized protein Yka (UPF0111/DUF47 family)
MKSFKGILVLGERNIFSGLSQILTNANQANATLKTMFQNTKNDQALTENMHTIRNIEKKCDEIALGLSEDITSGAISPNIIDDLIECVHNADDVMDLHFYLSRELTRMAKADTKEFSVHPEAEWVSVYLQLLGLAEQMLSKLQQMLSSSSIPTILQLHKEIEALEEQGDDIKDAGFDKLYAMAPKLHYLQFYHYSELMHKSDDILDECEDLADGLVSVVTSIIK